MKKSILIAFVLMACIIMPVQSQTDDVAILKKQVTILKSKNLKLEKSINALKKETTTQNSNMDVALKEFDTKLNAAMDSLQEKEKIITKTHYATTALFKSLKHRKHLFIIGSIIGIIIISGLAYFACKKYKADKANQEAAASNLMKVIEEGLTKTKIDLQSQIASTKDALEKKMNDLKK